MPVTLCFSFLQRDFFTRRSALAFVERSELHGKVASVLATKVPLLRRNDQLPIPAHIRRRDNAIVLPPPRPADLPGVLVRAPNGALRRARLRAAGSRSGRRAGGRRGRRRGRLRRLEDAGGDAGEPVPGDLDAPGTEVGELLEGAAREVEVEAGAAAAAVDDGDVDGFVVVWGGRWVSGVAGREREGRETYSTRESASRRWGSGSGSRWRHWGLPVSVLRLKVVQEKLTGSPGTWHPAQQRPSGPPSW